MACLLRVILRPKSDACRCASTGLVLLHELTFFTLHPVRPSLTSGSASRTDPDSERAIRFLIALMVLTCDPLAIALTAAASA
jgi:hypothetical protein